MTDQSHRIADQFATAAAPPLGMAAPTAEHAAASTQPAAGGETGSARSGWPGDRPLSGARVSPGRKWPGSLSPLRVWIRSGPDFAGGIPLAAAVIVVASWQVT